MKIKNYLIASILMFNFSGQAIASHSSQAEREQILHQYVMDLQAANYRDISQLFTQNGVVISTSRGRMNAKDFFYAFLPEIKSAKTEFHQSFVSNTDPNHYSARFHFTFTLKDGEKGDGEYIDEFVFENNSNKLSEVYMFENLHF